MDDPAAQLEPASCHEARAEPEPRTPRGVLDRAWQPVALIGDPPPLRTQSWGAEGRSFDELCPFLEPRANWTKSQADFEWTSEGTDEFLGHEASKLLRPKSPDRCLVQTRKRLEPVDGNEVRDEGGTTRSKPTLP